MLKNNLSLHIINRALPLSSVKDLIKKCETFDYIFVDDKEYSTYYRHDFVDKELSNYIHDFVKLWFPNSRIGNKWYLTKYLKGGFIDYHQDGHVSIDNQRSKYTILVYLNDDYTGGEVCFDDGSLITVRPSIGTIIVMDQDLWHKANPILSGEKYLLRADMIVLS